MEYTAGKPSLFERLSSLFSREPEDREQLLALLHSACERNLVDADVLAMLEGALQVSEMQVGEVMVSRAQMDVLQLDEPIDKIAAFVVDSGHSYLGGRPPRKVRRKNRGIATGGTGRGTA